MAEIGETVLVHCVGTLDDGREIQNSRLAGEPLQVKIGAGALLPALEGAICDMLPGDHRTVRLSPEQAYGAYDDALVQHVPANLLPNAENLPVGGFVGLQTRAGDIRAKVVSVSDGEVVLDCNHELAGHALTFDIEMISVQHESAIHRELHPAGCACGCDKLKAQIG